jgi:sugar phosphate isomerase/epimerase
MIEFDSYWALRGGQDPLEWIRKLGGRCDLLHQKDLPPGVKPVNLFDLFQQDPKMTMWGALATINAAQFAEIGSGVMNITDIIQAGRTCGHARYIIVEQDMTSLDELESVTISFKNLSQLLAGSQA